jgi:hypothetical protein
MPGFDSLHYQKKSSGSGTGSTQPREYNWGATWLKSSGSCLDIENTAVGIRHADHVAPSIRKKWAITSPTSGGCSVGIVRSRTQTMEFFFIIWNNILYSLETRSIKSRLRPEGSITLTTWHPLSTTVDTNFVDKRRSLGRYSSLRTQAMEFFIA